MSQVTIAPSYPVMSQRTSWFKPPRASAKRAAVAAERRKEARRKVRAKKYETSALQYTPARPTSGQRGIVPTRIKRKLLYSQLVSINPGAGVCGVHAFSANGMYDPDITGVGHQPKGFDEYMALYNHYKVTASKIHVEGDVAAYAVIIGVRAADQAMASGLAVSNVLEGAQTSWCLASIYAPHYKVSQDFMLSRDMPTQAKGDTVWGTDSSQPTDQWIYTVFLGPNDEATDLGGQSIRIVIEYEAEFFGPKSLAQS
ncbi:MAG: capsid protein [CRESS virus sp. ct4af14]|nr:MAG: capsid protein [CRESS virus sp. ct4af14]